jgi:hypothetical protein
MYAVRIIYKIITVFIGIQILYAVDLGESCPPCTGENTALKEEYEKLQSVMGQKKQSSEEVQQTQKRLKQMYLELRNAQRAKEQNASLASQILYNNAVQKYEQVQNEFKIKLAALASIMVDINSSRSRFVEVRKQLNECESRINPGLCKKCENGTIQADNSQNTGNPCTQCRNGEVLIADKALSYQECVECMGGKMVAKPDGAPVRNDPCQECRQGTVASRPDGVPCDDGDPCTVNDRCVNGACVGDVVTSNENPDCP